MTSDRSAYISAPLPIERELLLLFGRRARITILDVGACEGEDAVRYARLFPSSTVYAFEPVPSNLELIRETLARHGGDRIRVLPYALSDTTGVADLHVSSGRPPGRGEHEDWDYGNKSSSLLDPGAHISVHPWVRFETSVQVPTRRLADVCAEERIARLDFIHMDVQGAELMVLAGAGRLLDRVTGIWLEVEAIPLYRGQPVKREVEQFLGSHGFRKMKDTVGPISGDQLWVRSGAVRGTLLLTLDRRWREIRTKVARWYHRLVPRQQS